MIDKNYFRTLLEKEKKTLEEELATVGRKNPSSKGDWEAVESDINNNASDEADLADGIEEFETNNAIVAQLETQLAEVNSALERIEKGTYGICEVSGEEIEADRLEANPSARTCKSHMNN